MNVRPLVLPLALAVVACTAPEEEVTASSSEELRTRDLLAPMINVAGFAQSATPTGTVDRTNPFFQSLGTNGRSCNSCHEAETGWTITPDRIRLRFLLTGGKDPLFVALDGADSPTAAPTNVFERWEASRNLLDRGTIRVGLPQARPAANWDIDVEIVADPRNANALNPTNGQISFFRRPIPTMNLRFTAAVNWDGRNTPDLTNMRPGLLAQANGGTVGHAQAAAPLDDATRASIVDFELSLTTAQVRHSRAGALDGWGAAGGPEPLQTQPFAINAAGGRFSLFDAWTNDRRSDERRRVANGQRLFNERTFGANGGTCAGCHNAENVGAGTRFAFFDIGVSAAERWNREVPLYRVRQRSNPANVIETTDPGRAMITGQFADVNKFKVPGLRGLAARAPYFHDGSARSIEEVVRHYDSHFDIGLRSDERRDLVTFLESL